MVLLVIVTASVSQTFVALTRRHPHLNSADDAEHALEAMQKKEIRGRSSVRHSHLTQARAIENSVCNCLPGRQLFFRIKLTITRCMAGLLFFPPGALLTRWQAKCLAGRTSE